MHLEPAGKRWNSVDEQAETQWGSAFDSADKPGVATNIKDPLTRRPLRYGTVSPNLAEKKPEIAGAEPLTPKDIEPLDEVSFDRVQPFSLHDPERWQQVRRYCRRRGLLDAALGLSLAIFGVTFFFWAIEAEIYENPGNHVFLGIALVFILIWPGGRRLVRAINWLRDARLEEVLWTRGKVHGADGDWLYVDRIGYRVPLFAQTACRKGDIVTLYYLPRQYLPVGIEVHGQPDAPAEEPVERPQSKTPFEEQTVLEQLRSAAASGWAYGLPEGVRREVRRKGLGTFLAVIGFCYLFLLPLSYYGGPILVGGMLLAMALAMPLVQRLSRPPNPYGFAPGSYRAKPANEKERLVLEYLSTQPRPNPLAVFSACAAPVILALLLGVGFSQGIFNLAAYAGDLWEKAASITMLTIGAALFAFFPAGTAYWAIFYSKTTQR